MGIQPLMGNVDVNGSMDIVGESLYLDYYNGLGAILDGISHEPDDEQRFTGEIATISSSFVFGSHLSQKQRTMSKIKTQNNHQIVPNLERKNHQ